MRPSRYLVPAALVAVAAPLAAQGKDVILIRGATIHTAAGAPIPAGAILLRGGKVAAVGTDVAAPAGARVIDATGKVIIPGMIDNHSHIGARVSDVNDTPMLIGPQHRFLDALDMDDAGWAEAVAGGVTTVVTGPGSGENVSGMAVVIKTFGADLGRALAEALTVAALPREATTALSRARPEGRELGTGMGSRAFDSLRKDPRFEALAKSIPTRRQLERPDRAR